MGSRAGVGAPGEGAALLCSFPRSVWVLQSRLPVLEWADSNGVEGRTGEGVEGMDSERYSVPSRTPVWKKRRKFHNPKKLTGISSPHLCSTCSRICTLAASFNLPFHSTIHHLVLKYLKSSSVLMLLHAKVSELALPS